MKRHVRDNFFVVGEGILTTNSERQPIVQRPADLAALRKFRFSRLGPQGVASSAALREALATAMTAGNEQPDSANPAVPAGFTYLGQFVDHDLTFDKTARSLGENVTVAELVQGRSPALDLDSVYGRGPNDTEDARFYSDGVRLKMGRTAAAPFPPGDTVANVDRDGFDLPRIGAGSKKSERRQALIPDERNDENLVIAQTHLAFIRFHNRVVNQLASQGIPSTDLFNQARALVIKHYQWMLVHDFLPQLVDQQVLDEVFGKGRKFFETYPLPGDAPTMPIEFSVAAYRFGHSMVREKYEWNRIFRTGQVDATLALLFIFSGTSGILSPDGNLNDPESGSFERLPTNWIADFRRLFRFSETGRNDLDVAANEFNLAKRVDTLLVDPLKTLPLGSFGGRGTAPPPLELNLAFRNLTRAVMVELASGQQMAAMMGAPALSADQLLEGNGGADLSGLSEELKKELLAHTPLWFYVLREAELNDGPLTGVGGRIVAEVFHRAIEGSQVSILREPTWRPSFGPDADTFRMTDLLLFAFEGQAALLNPLGV